MNQNIELPTKIMDTLFTERSYRFRVLYGGRAAAKSHSIAIALLVIGANRPIRVLCAREFQNSIDDSVKQLLSDKIKELGLSDFYTVQNNVITGKNGTEFKFRGLRLIGNSIKSFEGCDYCWVEEAHTISKASWEILIPTIRKEGSEIWISFNPSLKTDYVYRKFVTQRHPDAIVTKVNYYDNPFVSTTSRRDAETEKSLDLEAYLHVWEGHCKLSLEGAIYARQLADATKESRITKVPWIPQMPVMTSWDLGHSDMTNIWFIQQVGYQYNCIDYYEANQQYLPHYLKILSEKPYTYSTDYLPHDANNETLAAKSIKKQMVEAGRNVQVVKVSSIEGGIEATRQMFNQFFFDEEKCSDGVAALTNYRYEYDQERKVFSKVPLHDWASHGCFTEDTKIITKSGTFEIKCLPQEGEVMTLWGWKPYINPKITRKYASVVEVLFAGGTKVKCTPDHLFLTEQGWKSAKDLANCTVIQSYWMKSPNTFMGLFTEYGRKIGTFLKAGVDYIETLGNQLSEKFPKIAISITKMETQAIICCGTWSVWIDLNTCVEHGKKREIKNLMVSQKRVEKKPLTGIDQQKVGYGTNFTHKELCLGQNGKEKKNPVLRVISNSMHWLENVIRKNIVRPNVNPLHVLAVKELNKKVDVWCLTVPNIGHFSLENGSIVHNCDALRTFAMGYKQKTTKPKADKVRIQDSGVVKDWMEN